MKIIQPVADLRFPKSPTTAHEIIQLVEEAGRACYLSDDKITDDSWKSFIWARIDEGHDSVIEHSMMTFMFITDRGIANELVRHRIASFSQESTRYVNYKNRDIEVVCPSGIQQGTPAYYAWMDSISSDLTVYNRLVESGVKPQNARSVLPLCLKTKIYMTANLREWRHVFKLRTSKAAHPDMRLLMADALAKTKDMFPVIFDDINPSM